MNNFDEILLEEYFPYSNMNINERSFYINLLLNTKDICDSEVSINSKSSCEYDLLYLNLKKNQNQFVSFDGVIANDSENRMINGQIVRSGNKFIVVTNVYRCNDCINEENKEYTVIDEFVSKSDRIIRKTRYDNGYYEAEIDLYTEMELEEYLQRKLEQIKLKR